MAAVCAGKVNGVPFSFAKLSEVEIVRDEFNPTSECHVLIHGQEAYQFPEFPDEFIESAGGNALNFIRAMAYNTETVVPLNSPYKYYIENIYYEDIARKDYYTSIGQTAELSDAVFYASGIYELGGATSLAIDVRPILIIDEDQGLAVYGQLYIESDKDYWSIGLGGSPSTPVEWARACYEAVKGKWSDSDDPYEDDAGDGGGHGTDDGDDNIDFPDLPDVSAVDTGFVNLYCPTLPQIKALASHLWTTDFYENIVKLWADPMDVILGLSIVPFAVESAGAIPVKCGNVNTGISMNHANSQWKILDCGSLDIHEYYGSYMDYSPYTKISIYLPYCGTHDLDTDEVMGKTVHIKYYIDILSGECVALIKCGNSVKYAFTGSCATNIPVTAANYSRLLTAGISAAGSLAATVATGGAAAPVAAGMALGAVNNMANSKPNFQRSGSLSGASGLLSIQKPYIIRQRPRACVPKNQNKYQGYPSFSNKKLSTLKGFTVVDSIRLDSLNLDKDEEQELLNILKGGVLL